MKYGIWNAAQPLSSHVNALTGSGYSPLTAMILAARGIRDARAAHEYLRCDAPLISPYAMQDMDLAAARVALAMTEGETVAVDFYDGVLGAGYYDVYKE